MLSILLILLLPYSFLFFGNYLTVTPLIVDMVTKFFMMRTKDPRSPEYRELLAAVMEDLREITGAEVASMLISNLLSLLLVMATVYTVAMASKGEKVTLKELLSRMRRTWKGPAATGLYVFLLSFGYNAVFFISIGVFAFVSNGSKAVLALGAVLAVLALLLLVYLQVLWFEALVISVVEEDCYGLAALGRASELIRGRRRLGFRVNFHLTLMTVIFFLAYNFVKSFLPPSEKMQLVDGLFTFYSSLMLTVFMLAVYVVFYYECKRSHGEEVDMKGSLAYTKVPTAPTLDGALP